MKKQTMMLDDAAIQHAFAAILLPQPMAAWHGTSCMASAPAPEAVEFLMDPGELIDPLDRFELELELGIPDRGSLARRIAGLLARPGAPATAPDDVARVVGLAAALASRLHFDGGAPCHLGSDDADAIDLSVAEFEAANFAIRAAAAVPRIVADNAGPFALVPARADTALFVATAAHFRIGVAVPAIGIIVRLLLRLLRLLWKALKNLFRLRKRVAAANRLRGQWAADVAAGAMSRAQYIKKLAGLIATLTAEIDALAATILAIQNEISEAEEELEGIEDTEARREADDLLRKLREQLEELRRQKEALEQEKRDAERERDAAQQQEGGG